jgi:hypothetical protein
MTEKSSSGAPKGKHATHKDDSAQIQALNPGFTGWPSGAICGYPMTKSSIFTNKLAIGLFGIIPSR